MGGTIPVSMDLMAASAAMGPAAPNIWPTIDLVPITGIWYARSPKTCLMLSTSASSPNGVLVACAKMVSTSSTERALLSSAPRIAFEVPAPGGAVRVAVYGADGRLIRTLVNGWSTAGRHTAEWDGRDETGAEAAAGVYFCLLETPGRSARRKMVMVE